VGSVKEREYDLLRIRAISLILADCHLGRLSPLFDIGSLRETAPGQGRMLVAARCQHLAALWSGTFQERRICRYSISRMASEGHTKSQAMSVDTFIDTELAQGERLLLPRRQDQPIICFRLEAVGQDFNLIVTDKMGNPEGSRPVDDQTASLMVEFSARARTWFLFKHDISRLYAIPQFRVIANHRHNVFREYLLPIQSSHEQQMKSVLQYADEVTVTI
jgi:hypothetical protein